ncbi:MAG: hypothetical protein ACYCTG_05475 [Ferrimicrobium sp.]
MSLDSVSNASYLVAAVPGFVSQLFNVTPSLGAAHLTAFAGFITDIIAALKEILLLLGVVVIFWGILDFALAHFHANTQRGVQATSGKRITAMQKMLGGVGAIVLGLMVGAIFASFIAPNLH